MTSRAAPRWAWAMALAGLAGIYAAGIFAVVFAPSGSPVAVWWPAAGLAVGLVAVAPRSWRPALVLGVVVFSGAANLTAGRPVEVSLGFGLANAAEAGVAAVLLHRNGRRVGLATVDDFLLLARAAAAGAVVAATGIAATAALLASASFVQVWITVAPSHAAAVLVVAPLAVGWRRGQIAGRTWELAAQVVVLVAITVLTFAPDQSLPLAFAPLPLLVWAALRFEFRVVAAELVAVSVLCTALSAQGLGPFGAAVATGDSSPAFAGTMVQIWLLSAALMSLPLTLAVEQRRQLLGQVSAREELFRRNFTDSLIGMLLLRPVEGRLQVTDANAAAREVLGDSGPLAGRHLDEILGPTPVGSELAEVVSGARKVWQAETGLTDRPGALVDVAVSQLGSGEKPVFSAQLLDVTEQRRNQQLLTAALDKERTVVERLRRLDSAKDEFVSTVSHELRTPITSIVGYTEMLQDGGVVEPLPEQVPLLETVARSGERLIAICNDLLMLAGLDSGASTWDRERFDLRLVMGPLSEAMRPMIDDRRLDLRFAVPDEPLHVVGDRAQLERAVLNLLSNSVKFTEDPGEVECRLERHGDEVAMVVRDTGVGIPVAEQGDLFTRFFRSTTAQQRAIPGTGLGLSIVAGIMEAHAGRIDVESAHLEGTTVTLTLPLAT